MKKLLINEWIKMRYSKQLWILFAGTFALILLLGFGVQGAPGRGFWYVGITSSFEYLNLCGSMIMMLLAPVVGIFFTQEFQQGTMHNTLSCGISRKQYFAVKTLCAIASGFVLYAASILLYVFMRTLRAGVAPSAEAYPDCGFAVVAVFQLGSCIQVFTYITCFILVSVLAKRTAIINLAGIVIWSIEAILYISLPSIKSPVSSIIASRELWSKGKVLTMEFLQQNYVCIILIIVFLMLSYLVFMKRDIN